jgi:hypothetical protein
MAESSFTAFADEHAARQFLLDVLGSPFCPDFDEDIAPLHKWLRAIYVADGGSLAVRPEHVATVAGVSLSVAAKMLRRIEAAATVRSQEFSSGRTLRSVARALSVAVSDEGWE